MRAMISGNARIDIQTASYKVIEPQKRESIKPQMMDETMDVDQQKNQQEKY